MIIGKVSVRSRRAMGIGINLVNMGNAPAIEILIDGEIILEYKDIKGVKEIPARLGPRFISYLRPGEELQESPFHSLSFGNTCIKYFIDDLRECKRLNIQRIETNPTRMPYPSSILKIYIYYRNNLGQYFESIYKTRLNLKEIPKDDENAEVREVYVTIPEFHSAPIGKKKVDINISSRNSRRHLSGW